MTKTAKKMAKIAFMAFAPENKGIFIDRLGDMIAQMPRSFDSIFP
jgi:hypothetical protein